MKKTILILLSAFALSLPAFAWVREQNRFPYALVQEPAAQAGAYMYAGTGLPYYPAADFSPVPDSLATVFVNHVGRHGARYLSSAKYVSRLRKYLGKCRNLTPIGRNVKWLCDYADSVTRGRWGALDPEGMTEQDSIGARFVRRYPGLFTRSDSVAAISSYVPRCVMSMDCMTHSILQADTLLNLSAGSGPRYNALLRPFDVDSAYIKYMDTGEWSRIYRNYVDTVCPTEPIRRLASDSPALSDRKARELSMDLYRLVSGSMSYVPRLGWRPFFEEQEYRRLWQCANLRHYLTHSATALSDIPERMAIPLRDELIATLDAAAQPGYTGPAAILRFGHAETLMPLLSLMRIPGCRYITADWGSVARNWQDSCIVPMAANLQLALLRSRHTGTLYLQVYLNESPVLPLMPWAEARAGLLR